MKFCRNLESVVLDIIDLFLFRRESGATIIMIEETHDGKVDLNDLEAKLAFEHGKRSKSKATLIGCFTAASNVTGQVNYKMIDVWVKPCMVPKLSNFN